MNRAASGKYPPSWCAVIKQPAQFSFVRHGEFPMVDTASRRVAQGRRHCPRSPPPMSFRASVTDVLWYHANYVAPSWGRRLSMVQKIGAHIFYRA